tara:strand:+ start:362 stop:1216 length:855 start_codon:yes stop_codon:yes gene_type:complete
MNIVGIGKAGCSISNYLSKYDTYNTYQVDVCNNDYKNFIEVTPRKSHQEYEENYEPIGVSLCDGPTTIILSGAGAISGTALRVLQELGSASTKVLYIKPRALETSQLQKTRHKITNQILQQYARSDRLGEVMMIDNALVESLVSEISLVDFWSPINQIIGDTFHMINVLSNTEPLLKSSYEIPGTAKISTLSLVDLEHSDEKMFYDLEHPRAKNYYFALGEEYIKNNKDLLPQVRSFVADRSTEKCDCAYQIHRTEYEQNYVYGYHYATFVQEQDKKLFTPEGA